MTSPSTRLLSLTSRILFAFALLVFVGYFVIYCVYAFALFRFPYDYDQGEGFELNDSILFARGEWPYKDNETFPFYASNYGPVFHLLALPLFPIFGQTLTAGRVLSFLATLTIGAIVYRVVQRQTRDRPIAALSGLMVFASNFVYHIGPLFRQHMTMVLFELLAVVAIAGRGSHAPNAQGHVRSRNIVVSMLFLLLAGYTKQLSAATAVAVLAFLFLRAPKKSIVAGLGLAAAAGAIFVWMNIATNGQWFINSITANANLYDYKQAVDLYGQFFSLHFVIAALAIGYLVYELYWDRLSAYSVWFAFALANAALSGKWGAGESYFTTAVVAACIASGMAIGKLKQQLGSDDFSRQHNATKVATTIAIPLLYLAQAWGVRHLPTDGPIFGPLADVIGVGRSASVYANPPYFSYPYYDAIGYTQVGHWPTDEDARAGDRIVEHLLNSEKPVLSEEAAFVLQANRRVRTGGQPVITNPTQLLNLWNNHAYDPINLIVKIDRQDFGLVVLRAQFYPDPVLRAIGARYAPIDDIWMNGFQYRILAPRGDALSPCDEAGFYGFIGRLNTYVPAGGFFRIASRDTRPEGWSGPTGVSELEYRIGDRNQSRGPYYRLWVAPLDWHGDPPPGGNGAARLHQDRCFQYFDIIDDNDGDIGQAVRDAVSDALGLRG